MKTINTLPIVQSGAQPVDTEELLNLIRVVPVGYDAAVAAAFRQIPEGLCCEFGVYEGRTFIPFAETLAPRILYGFDSFQGLPEDWCAQAPKGSFRGNPLALQMPANGELVIGLYQDTLKDFLRDHEGPVAFCHLDSDLYSSTKYVLTTVSGRLAQGAVLIFDDIIGDKVCHDNVARAVAEWVSETGISFEIIGMRHRKAAIFKANI